MATRIFGIIIWSAYMVLTLYYRGILLDMAQRASDAGVGVGHVFFLGTGFGIMLASAFFMTVLATKSLVSYLINIHKKNKQARLGAKESTGNMGILSKPKIRVSCSRKIRIVAYSSAIFLFVLIATILATMLPVPVYTVDAERMVKTLETYHPLHCFLYENGITKMRISFGDKKYRIPIYIDLDKNTLAEKQLQNYLNTYINSLAGQNAKKYSIRIKSSSSFNDDDHFIHLDDKINHNSIGKLPQEIQANYKALEKLDTDSVIKTLGKTDYKYYRFPDKHSSDSSEDTLMELIWCYILDRNTAKELVLIFDCAINSAISEQSMYVKHAFIDINSHRLIPTKEGVQSENSSESQVSLH